MPEGVRIYVGQIVAGAEFVQPVGYGVRVHGLSVALRKYKSLIFVILAQPQPFLSLPSIVGIYKGIVGEEFITSNTFTYFQEAGARKEKQEATASKIIKSNTQPVSHDKKTKKSDDDYHFVDTLAIIQDVAFKLEENPAPKLHWWNRFGIWLSKLWRK